MFRPIALILLGLSPPAVRATGCLHYDLPPITVEGRVTRGERIAATGYQSDSISKYRWYLTFSRPVCVSGNGSETVNAAFQADLWPNNSTIDLMALDGKTVRASGQFLPTQLPHYHAYLIFSAVSVEPSQHAPPNNSLERSRER